MAEQRAGGVGRVRSGEEVEQQPGHRAWRAVVDIGLRAVGNHCRIQAEVRQDQTCVLESFLCVECEPQVGKGKNRGGRASGWLLQ